MREILIINNGYPSATNPQYSTYIESIYKCLVDSDFKVSLLVLDTNFKTKLEKLINYYKYYISLFLHDYSKYEIVYIHNYPHSFIPMIFKLHHIDRLVIHWHGTDIIPARPISAMLNYLSYQFIPKRTEHFSPSEYFSGLISKKLKIPRKKIFVSPSGGVDTDIFCAPKLKKIGQKITMGYASSMRTEKGIDLILKIAEKSDEIRKMSGKGIAILCIKYGAEKDRYCKELSKYDNITIIEPILKNEMAEFYNNIDVLLLPTRMSESLALVGLEAMSCSTPVIGTNDYAIKDYIIDGESGEKFEKGDIDSLVDCIIKVIKNIEYYQPQKIVLEKYSTDYVIEQYKKYFGNKNG